MKSSEELSQYFYQQLHGELQVLEDERLRLVKMISTIRKILIVAGCVLILSFVGLFFGLFLFALVFVVKYLMSTGYVFKFKERVLKALVQKIDNSLQYIHHESIHQVFITRSQLFPSYNPSPNSFVGNDLVRGTIKGVKVQFSDIHIQHHFQGIFMVAEFNKTFKSTLVVVPDRLEAALGRRLGQSLQQQNMYRGSLMKMDSPAFEKVFSVYGSDPVETRYLLTHSMMERLLNFQNRTRAKLRISFVKGYVYIAIENGRDSFEPSVSKSVFDYSQIRDYIDNLLLLTGVVEELKLNEKLWSKA